jgi:raffinose/stachyose/melibiose transport system substrate-binding protein
MNSARLTRLAGVLLVSSLLLLGLAACGDQTTTAPTTTTAATTTSSTVTTSGTAATTTQVAAGGPQRELKVWVYEAADNAMGASWADAEKDYQAAHPNVKIDWELKTFDQIQQTAQMILNSSDVPDVMEINKGNATAGLYAKQGLLTDLTQTAQQRGWDKLMSPSIQATSRYDTRGIMGSGNLYGVTTYGEFVMVYYNKDMFQKYGVKVPTNLDEFETACDTFVKAGITPIGLGASDKYTITQNFYELALYKADRNFVTNYMTFANDVDFHGPEFSFAAQKLQDEFSKGYYSVNATGVTANDANAAFEQAKTPMILTGSWQFGPFLKAITSFQWGVFTMPGKKLNTGSGGNLLVVPQNAKNKDLAYDFLDLTLAKKAQTAMAQNGGIPLNADLTQITEPHTVELNQAFNNILKNDGLAFYPDWPAPGYMDALGGGLQELITKKKTPTAFLDAVAGPWKEYKSALP